MPRTAQRTEDGAEDAKVLSRVLLRLAHEVEEADRAIKLAILQAAQAGDVSAIESIIERWLTEPPVEVAESLRCQHRS